MGRRSKSKRPRRRGNKRRPTTTKRKMSEMLSEMAGDFIGIGDTVEMRENRLVAACSAWNMACASPEIRQQQIEHYMEQYQQFNPAASDVELADVRGDMLALIDRKLQKFPDDQRQIVDARIVPMGKDFRIEIASAMFH